MFANLMIGKRLGLAFGVMALLILVVAGMGVLRLTTIGAETDLILKDRYVKVQTASEVMDQMNDTATAIRNALLANDPEQTKKYLAAAAKTGTSDEWTDSSHAPIRSVS